MADGTPVLQLNTRAILNNIPERAAPTFPLTDARGSRRWILDRLHQGGQDLDLLFRDMNEGAERHMAETNRNCELNNMKTVFDAALVYDDWMMIDIIAGRTH